MHLIEHFVQGKSPDPARCEDGWVFTPDFAAVVDGSTSKVPGRHGGREAMLCVCEALKTLPAEAGKSAMLHHLTASLAAIAPPQASVQAEYRPTCVAAIYSRSRRVVWLVGDCQCRWGGHTHTHPKPVDGLLTGARCDAVRYLLAHGHTAEALRRHDLGRAFMADALREQTNFQNDPNPCNPYRYPALDGTEVCPALVPELPVPIYIKECVLATDGYPQLYDTLEHTEQALCRLLRADPLCISQNPATKAWVEGNHSFDDRCYLRLAL